LQVQLTDDEIQDRRNRILFDGLSPMQKACARLLAYGATKVDVAKQVGITDDTLYKWSSKPGFNEYVNKLADLHAVSTMQVHAEAKQEFDNLVMRAVKRLEYLMDNATSENVQEKAAIDILHLAGLKPIDKAEVTERHVEQLVMVDPTMPDTESFDDPEDIGIFHTDNIISQAQSALYGDDTFAETG